MNVHTTKAYAKKFAREHSQLDIVRKIVKGSDTGKFMTFSCWKCYDSALEQGFIRK